MAGTVFGPSACVAEQPKARIKTRVADEQSWVRRLGIVVSTKESRRHPAAPGLATEMPMVYRIHGAALCLVILIALDALAGFVEFLEQIPLIRLRRRLLLPLRAPAVAQPEDAGPRIGRAAHRLAERALLALM